MPNFNYFITKYKSENKHVRTLLKNLEENNKKII